MDKDSFLEKITEIGTIEDDSERRTKLAELTEDVSKVFDDVVAKNTEIETLNSSIEKAKEEQDKLREYNMELFKRVPVSKTDDEIKKGNGIDPEPEPRKFENLFDKEGGLKL